MDFKSKFNNWAERINKALDGYIIEKDTPEKTIYSAMRYSLTAGGKRLRPVLGLAVCELLDGDVEEVIPFACAVEMIHTYSLIHDDLPAMDNDDYRRGKLTNHKVFGEAMAILAGDALLNSAFEIMLEASAREAEGGVSPKVLANRIKAMGIIAKASGASGMIGGQVVDIESEGKKIDKERLLYLHNHKTGELIRASVSIGAIYAGKDENIMSAFSKSLGLAFQIKDDILDVEGNCEKLGKKTRKDGEKSTFVTLFGLDVAKEMLKEETNKAVLALEKVCADTTFLKDLAYYLLDRQS